MCVKLCRRTRTVALDGEGEGKEGQVDHGSLDFGKIHFTVASEVFILVCLGTVADVENLFAGRFSAVVS